MIEEINANTVAEKHRIVLETKRETSLILSEAKKKAFSVKKQLVEQAHASSSREKARVSSAKMRGQRLVAEAEYALVEKVLKSAKKDLPKVAKEKRYPKLFAFLAKQATAEFPSGDFRVLCNKRDFSIAKKFSKTPSALDCSGGLVVTSADGKVRANNTFEALFEERKEALEQKAFEKLFSKKR